MLKRIPYEQLALSKESWLESRFHFSFAQYHNPHNMNFGVLRVMNDDIIAPHSGFGMHPHQNMEIFTYVLEGALTHEDSMGNKETLHAGDIQYLSAGSGIYHSEKNASDAPARIIQTWILPNAKGVTPQYGSYKMDKKLRHNRWEHLFGENGVIALHQDANVYAMIQEGTTKREFMLKDGRQAYLKVMSGEVVINGLELHYGDALEVKGESLLIDALCESHLLVIEMAEV